ncbi:VWA domain-containing protein [Sulfitobacter sp. F26169L]|uniref:nitric oxide reductase activation protein NorD n=1 Tax=Sulfitobacter sp. F26169L TaxID=2996015 RepID=UPI002260829D|nr:VWA domain-containing protein [Sulfitobacter sp. F26169L]MCX7566155.1 VWA domain-containing protein [Sulfitobacter sp. F26169L]
MHLLDLMEPEETVGNLWHNMAHGMGTDTLYPDAAVMLADVRPSLAVLFRALGGDAGVEFGEAPATLVRHRRTLQRKLGSEREKEYIASFDGERLRLPPFIATYPERALNRATYFWLVALAAHAHIPAAAPTPHAADCDNIRANGLATVKALAACAGLRDAYRRMVELTLAARSTPRLPAPEAAIEQAVRDWLSGAGADVQDVASDRQYMPFAPVPFWLRFDAAGSGVSASVEEAEEAAAPPPTAATTSRKLGERKDRDEVNRKDSFILHRFESILSWVESMNLNRSVDDDDDENAQKAADDQDNITLSKVDKKAATRLRLHLDLSPSDADHEKLAGEFTYPEWNHRSRSYMDAHCRVLDAPAVPDEKNTFTPNAARIREVRRQFETLRPRRILRPRQIDGSELDLDALISAQANLKATGHGSDRIWQSARQIERDLAVAFLIDTSRSTEAAVGDTCVIDVAREALAALATGIDAAGDSLGIWGFSSLRRDRVFLTRCKGFETKMSPAITANICALIPGHYTRLGAAIRHTSAMLAEQSATRKLLIVLTDGKPNDLDHYEGQHGVEDSRMAVREARSAGQSLHGVIIDEDGQDWFARIFGRGGFSLLPDPARLPRALPDIYRTLTQET